MNRFSKVMHNTRNIRVLLYESFLQGHAQYAKHKSAVI